MTTHRIILAVQSKYFQGVFRYEKKEKIDMNLSAETLCTVVRAMYPGRAELTTDNIQGLTEASDYLQIRDLSPKCVDFLTKSHEEEKKEV